MTEPGGEQFHGLPEYFRDPTPDTLEMFNGGIKRVKQELIGFAATLRRDYIAGNAGDPTGPHVDFRASMQERRRPTADNVTVVEADLSVRIAAGPGSPRARLFRNGETVGTMTDAEYDAAIANLYMAVPSDDWAWIDKARLFAGDRYDASFLPFAINELLDAPPAMSPVRRSQTFFLDPLYCNNGTRLQATWLKANPAYERDLSDDDITHQVTLVMPTDERYEYLAFTDDTKQMFVEVRDAAARAALAAQGYTVIDRSDNTLGSVEITPAQRRLGLHAPNDILMRQFGRLLHEALEAGIAME